MGTLEIVLLGAGAIIFIMSFCIPVKKEKLKEETRNLAAEEVKSLVSEELENVRGRLSELSEEEMQQQIEKSERSMERISNEKIMAVNEYSDTVLDEIHKSHEEVVFLYDMLKNKKESLSESYGKADLNIQELLQQVKDSEITVKESLAEIEKKKEEISKLQVRADVYAPAMPGRQEAAAQAGAEEISAPAAAGKIQAGAGKVLAMAGTAREEEAGARTAGNTAQPEEAVFTEAAGADRQAGEAETPAFRPFVPEKVEAVPKKKTTRKTAKKPEADKKDEAAGEKAAGKKPAVKRQAKAAEPEEEKAAKTAAAAEEKAAKAAAKEEEAAKAAEEEVTVKTAAAEEEIMVKAGVLPEEETAKPAAEIEKEALRTAAADENKGKAAFAPEDAGMMLLLSDPMENKTTNSNGRILELHKAGKSNMAIARELGLGIGEVKLVIELYEGLR